MANDTARLGQAIADRRRELGLSQVGVWRRGGPSNSTLTRLENGEGEPPSPSTLRKLDTGLDWTSGSAANVLNGGSPSVATPLFVDRNAEPDYVYNPDIDERDDPRVINLPRTGEVELPAAYYEDTTERLTVEANRASEYNMRIAVEEGALDPHALESYRRTIRREIETVILAHVATTGDLASLLEAADYTTLDDLFSQITGTSSSDLDLKSLTNALSQKPSPHAPIRLIGLDLNV